MSDGIKLLVKIVGIDFVIDLVVLKINFFKVMKMVSFGNLDNIKVGEMVLVIGLLMGFNYVMILM